MTALPTRRAPRRCDDGASGRAFTRRPATAGSTRRTYEGSGETALGASRGGAGRVIASAGHELGPNGNDSSVAANSTKRRRRFMRSPPSPVGVLSLVPGAELTGLQRTPPRLVLAIPTHRRLQRGGEPMTGRPAEPADLRRVHRVPTIVSGAIGHPPDERLGLAGELQDLPGEHDVFDLVTTAHVVHLAVAPAPQDEVNRRTVVEHIEPVADVAAITVQRQRLLVERVGDEERDHLLGVLIRPEIVRRAGDHERHAM